MKLLNGFFLAAAMFLSTTAGANNLSANTLNANIYAGGHCVNQGGNSAYDIVCRTAGEARGPAGCYQYVNLGCTWIFNSINQ